MPQTLSFAHMPIRIDDRILIESCCAVCGESRIVSAADGSIVEWERGHRCEETVPPLALDKQEHFQT
jgi:hypothetical protein